MSAHHSEIVIVRRRSALEDAHHGGAWKIAFADFMTAMMAFFLVLWIISATDKNTKTIIARYFNPVKVEEPAKAQKGIRGAPEQDTDAPGMDSGVPNAEKSRSDQGETARGSVPESPEAPPKEAKHKHQARPEPMAPPDPARPNPTMSEEELFSDPRASIDKIAGVPPPGPRVDPSAALKGYGEVGPSADEAIRDPFRPLGSDKAINVATTDPGAPPRPDASGDEPKLRAEQSEPAPGGAGSQGPARQDTSTQDLSRQDSAKREAKEPPSEAAAAQANNETPPTAEANSTTLDSAQARAAGLLGEVKKRLGADAQSVPGPQLDVQATDEGILISLTDRQNFSMFAIGSAEPQARVVRMMDAIAMSLETLPGAIVVRGHTDAHPYRSATYDNWRLSSARAQMAYYMLERAGIPEKRFERIEGFADHRLKDPAHPFAAENRRIEILLREAKP
jgi:chemotaxis protein MotB